MTAQVPVEIHPEAVDEAASAHQWYAERSRGASQAFESELDRAILAISEAPCRWVRHIANTRRFVLQRYPFSVVYYELPGSVLVLAVAHGHRRPGYWRTRLPSAGGADM